MVNYCGKRKEIQDTLWSVFTSFGYKEIEKQENFEDCGKFCYFDKNEAVCVNNGGGSTKAYAEKAALCIEASIACGLDNFEITVSDVLVYDHLVLFGFEKMVKLGECDGFKAVSKNIEFAHGCFKENKSCCKFDMDEFTEALKENGVDMEEDSVSASLIYAEKNAEGIAYDVAYSLRVNGCIIEYYNENEDIETACKYAEKMGYSCVIRAYEDGTLKIKDMLKNEIIQTTIQEFLGYYEEDEECGCDCGEHSHEHGECDCGHHGGGHEHDSCGCGHHDGGHDKHHEHGCCGHHKH